MNISSSILKQDAEFKSKYKLDFIIVNDDISFNSNSYFNLRLFDNKKKKESLKRYGRSSRWIYTDAKTIANKFNINSKDFYCFLKANGFKSVLGIDRKSVV